MLVESENAPERGRARHFSQVTGRINMRLNLMAFLSAPLLPRLRNGVTPIAIFFVSSSASIVDNVTARNKVELHVGSGFIFQDWPSPGHGHVSPNCYGNVKFSRSEIPHLPESTNTERQVNFSVRCCPLSRNDFQVRGLQPGSAVGLF